MADLSGKTALVYDHGSFVPFAQRLADFFGEVKYFSPWVSAFPRLADCAPGAGVPGLRRVYNFWDAVGDADCVVFPDSYDGDVQDHLRSQGKRVWGSGGSSFLELDRWQSRQLQRKLGLAVPPTKRVIGMDALRRLLRRTTDRWVKTSTFRDDFETFHHEKDFTSGPFLDVLAERYGPLGGRAEFIVEKGVPGTEVGWDAHSIDGAYPELGLLGLETKDRGLIGSLVPFASLPPGVRGVYEKLAPALAEGRYRNYITIEMRVDGKGAEPVVIDPCCRLGSPASEGWMELCDNLGDVVWEGSAGRLVEVEASRKYTALVVIHSPWALKHWTPIDVPPSVARWVKIKNLTVVGGKHYYAPGRSEMQEIGVVVGVGNSPEEAVGHVTENCDAVSGYSLNLQTDALRESLEAVAEAEALGMPF